MQLWKNWQSLVFHPDSISTNVNLQNYGSAKTAEGSPANRRLLLCYDIILKDNYDGSISTEFIKKNLESFSYFEFCKSFPELFRDEQECLRVLKRILESIAIGKSNSRIMKRKVRKILGDFEIYFTLNLVKDKDVNALLLRKKFRIAATEKP
ncbi:hypothetical protein BDF20DRAFT_991515 [Mycotypha africana]|uniref:uncharacterized protein n=1 Tax=Mycotypha africana TaxID=64632 RepID=UPI00230173E6|nr:uncharacterized protein BDF20DRAFT_991515 [Mycotypha africana]KAI8967866.1 hypothetical protein BDF20DRAFT_991515 [Mycotypha africana]